MAAQVRNEPFVVGGVAPIARGPRTIPGQGSSSRAPVVNPTRPAVMRAPWAAPIAPRGTPPGLCVPESMVPGQAPFAASPSAVKATAPLVSGMAVNVRVSLATGSAPPKAPAPTTKLPGTKRPEPIRVIGFPLPGRKVGGTEAHTAKPKRVADGREMAPDPSRSWGGGGKRTVPLPVPMRRGEISTMIAPKSTGPLPAWAPGASRQPGGLEGKAAGVGFRIGAPAMTRKGGR